MGIYYLTIRYLSEYINMAKIDDVFLAKVLLIVAGSWLVLFIFEKVSECISPSFTKRILMEHPPLELVPSDQVYTHPDDRFGQGYDRLGIQHAPSVGKKDVKALEVEPLLH